MTENYESDPALLAQVEAAIKEEVTVIVELNEVASKHPYYKYVTSRSFHTSPFILYIE